MFLASLSYTPKCCLWEGHTCFLPGLAHALAPLAGLKVGDFAFPCLCFLGPDHVVGVNSRQPRPAAERTHSGA